VPIKDSKKNITGVLQAINKKEGITKKNMFSPDDEGLLMLLAQYAGVVLKQNVNTQLIKQQQTKLEYLMSGIQRLSKVKDYSEFIKICCESLKELIQTNAVRFFLVDEMKS